MVLVGVPRPWPKPVFDLEVLNGLSATMETTLGTTRVMAFVAEPADETTVLIYSGLPFAGRRFAVSSQDVVDFVREPTLDGAVDWPEPVLAVCTQGSHDVCCGTDGTRFAQAAANVIPVLAVSHTGGHRFAPTAVELPSGRMWANLDIETLQQIVSAEGPVPVANYRGSVRMPAGPVQVAEAAAFARFGWDWQPTGFAEEGDIVEITGNLGSESYRVGPTRQVPTVGCRSDAEPKTRLEYEAELLV